MHVESTTIYYLEMRDSKALNSIDDSKGLSVIEAEIDCFQLNKFLYEYVGKPWQWQDKLLLSDDEWQAYVSQAGLRTWVAYYKGAIAGYFELFTGTDNNTEIMYFGLAEDFIGRGFGGYLLSEAIKTAWTIQGAKRVWVHTCSLDHPSALKNYESRGFTRYKTETE